MGLCWRSYFVASTLFSKTILTWSEMSYRKLKVWLSYKYLALQTVKMIYYFTFYTKGIVGGLVKLLNFFEFFYFIFLEDMNLKEIEWFQHLYRLLLHLLSPTHSLTHTYSLFIHILVFLHVLYFLIWQWGRGSLQNMRPIITENKEG